MLPRSIAERVSKEVGKRTLPKSLDMVCPATWFIFPESRANLKLPWLFVSKRLALPRHSVTRYAANFQ